MADDIKETVPKKIDYGFIEDIDRLEELVPLSEIEKIVKEGGYVTVRVSRCSDVDWDTIVTSIENEGFNIGFGYSGLRMWSNFTREIPKRPKAKELADAFMRSSHFEFSFLHDGKILLKFTTGGDIILKDTDQSKFELIRELLMTVGGQEGVSLELKGIRIKGGGIMKSLGTFLIWKDQQGKEHKRFIPELSKAEEKKPKLATV